jgi:threonine synthase
VNPPVYFEAYVYKTHGAAEVQRYLDACTQKRIFFINEAQQLSVTFDLTASVVSTQRIDTVIAGMYQSNQYNMDHNAALSYSALQDYRARNGFNKTTLI